MVDFKKIGIFTLVIILITSFFIFDLSRFLSLDYLKSSQDNFAIYYTDNAIQVIGIFFLIYILVTGLSLPGAAIMTLAAGAFFGLYLGVLIVSFASSIGATLAALFSRYVFRDFVEKKFEKTLKTVNIKIKEEGAFYLFTLRLIPAFPFFVINMVMGLTKMKLFTYYWVSQIGMLLGTIVFVNAGVQIANIDSLSGILSPGLIFSFILIGVLPIIIKKGISIFKKKKNIFK